MNKLVKDAMIIFALGVTTYAWWKISAYLKSQLNK